MAAGAQPTKAASGVLPGAVLFCRAAAGADRIIDAFSELLDIDLT